MVWYVVVPKPKAITTSTFTKASTAEVLISVFLNGHLAEV